MTDYTFMKTGMLGNAPSESPGFEEFVTKILGVITVMLQKAVETAGVFAEHGGYHREINADDIRRAMKVQAQTFFKSDDLEDRVASVVGDMSHQPSEKKINLRKIRGRGRGRKRQRRRPSDVPDPLDIDFDPDLDFDLDFDLSPTPDPELPYNVCECRTCTDIRALVGGWDTWDPEDEVEKFLKKHIEAM